jgi:biopolymer transport protein ExbD
MINLTDPISPPQNPNITPLLDVVFILLIFFVVSSVFAVQGMEMDLPEAASSRSISGRSHTIRITPDNTLQFDDTPITPRELSFRLGSLKAVTGSQSPDRLILECSPNAHVGTFISTADTIRSAGFEDLVIATRRPGGHEES